MGKISIETSGKSTIPAYGELTVKVNDNKLISPIAGEGEFYLENILPGHYTANVEYEKGICSFDLNVPKSQEQIINLGNIKCVVP